MKKTLAVLMMLLLLAMLIVSCEADGPVIHKVTFDSGNGNEAKVESVIDGEKTVKPADPVMTGYTFLGWYDGDTLFDFESPVKKDYSLTAKWQIQTFTVSFDANGGEGNYEFQAIDYGGKVDTTKVANPTRTGHTFLGWFDGSEKFDIYNTPITGDIALTAQWDYKVTFDSDNGEAPVYFYIESARTIAEGAVANPKKEGFAFKGWYTDPEDETTKFEFGKTQVTTDLKLTAKWNKTYICIVDYDRTEADIVNEYYEVEDGYKFHFTDKDSNGYDWDISKYVEEYNTKHSSSLVFKGWYYDSVLYEPGSELWKKEEITVTKPVTLTAAWTDKTTTFHTVTFVDKDGTTELLTAKVEDGKAVNDWTPSKEGYTFVGWYTEDGKTFDFDKTPVTGNIKLKAEWKDSTYTVTFDSNGGTPDSYKLQSVEYKGKVTKPNNNPIKYYGHFQLYTFLGWYNGSEKFDFEKMTVADNITLTAKWGYTVTFNSNGGSTVASQVVEKGSSATKPKDPKRTGFIFDKWTTDEAGTKEYDFTSEVQGHLKLYAQWTLLEVGKTVQLGTVSWKVLAIADDQKSALLISEKVWETCTFNSINLGDTFIKKYGLENVDMCNVDVSGETTKVGEGNDKVFLLSKTEAKTYFGSNGDRKANNGRCSWWLRSVDYYTNMRFPYIVTEKGEVGAYNISWDNSPRGLRPAFWINLNM